MVNKCTKPAVYLLCMAYLMTLPDVLIMVYKFSGVTQQWIGKYTDGNCCGLLWWLTWFWLKVWS